jgi:hypothetical protein
VRPPLSHPVVRTRTLPFPTVSWRFKCPQCVSLNKRRAVCGRVGRPHALPRFRRSSHVFVARSCATRLHQAPLFSRTSTSRLYDSQQTIFGTGFAAAARASDFSGQSRTPQGRPLRCCKGGSCPSPVFSGDNSCAPNVSTFPFPPRLCFRSDYLTW